MAKSLAIKNNIEIIVTLDLTCRNLSKFHLIDSWEYWEHRDP